jgi:acetyl-CoA carboxylase beta subunit
MAASAIKCKQKRRQTSARKKCPVCTATGSETFWFLRKSFIFDVDRAREITQDGRSAILLDRDDVRYAVDSSRITDSHVPHVNVSYPGIIARVRYTQDDGSVVTGDVLIDGHHRAARCLQLRRPFSVYLLNYAESDAVLTRRPDANRRKKRRPASRAQRPSKARTRVAKKRR